MDQHRRRYALACALSVRTGHLLHELHASFGRPVDDLSETSNGSRELFVSCAHSYGAAAACSALAARLLLVERDQLGIELGEPMRPQFKEVGVNIQEASEISAWRAVVRATAAARGELTAAKTAWQECHVLPTTSAPALVDSLLGYVDALATMLEATEPSRPLA